MPLSSIIYCLQSTAKQTKTELIGAHSVSAFKMTVSRRDNPFKDPRETELLIGRVLAGMKSTISFHPSSHLTPSIERAIFMIISVPMGMIIRLRRLMPATQQKKNKINLAQNRMTYQAIKFLSTFFGRGRLRCE